MCLDEANGGLAIPRNDSATGLSLSLLDRTLEVAQQIWLIVSKHPTAIDSSYNYVGHCLLRKARPYRYLTVMIRSFRRSRVKILAETRFFRVFLPGI
jgi:hypothetical protein